MQLMKHTKVNKQYFAKGSSPSRQEWIQLIDTGALSGKVSDKSIWVDVDDFVSKDFLVQPAPKDAEENEIDLLD